MDRFLVSPPSAVSRFSKASIQAERSRLSLITCNTRPLSFGALTGVPRPIRPKTVAVSGFGPAVRRMSAESWWDTVPMRQACVRCPWVFVFCRRLHCRPQSSSVRLRAGTGSRMASPRRLDWPTTSMPVAPRSTVRPKGVLPASTPAAKGTPADCRSHDSSALAVSSPFTPSWVTGTAFGLVGATVKGPPSTRPETASRVSPFSLKPRFPRTPDISGISVSSRMRLS